MLKVVLSSSVKENQSEFRKLVSDVQRRQKGNRKTTATKNSGKCGIAFQHLVIERNSVIILKITQSNSVIRCS